MREKQKRIGNGRTEDQDESRKREEKPIRDLEKGKEKKRGGGMTIKTDFYRSS